MAGDASNPPSSSHVDPGPDLSLIARLEELAASAWPARQTLYHRGWMLRVSGGLSRRANCITPVSTQQQPDIAALPTLVAHSHRLGQSAVVRLRGIPNETAIDDSLANEGWTREGDTEERFGPITPQLVLGADATLSAVVTTEPSAAWLDAYIAWHRLEERRAQSLRSLVALTPLPAAWVQLGNPTPLAIAAVAVDPPIGYLHAVVVDPHQRGAGHGLKVVQATVAAALRLSATHLSINVETTNTPAKAVYSRLGITTELYRCWYRREPQ
ncbi:MAG: GNAT family N-acetyltransferase [Alphaproteobacteria bacterium]|nr:GNAT family N-acetyltransferase [Alphaproteobacteria bacterium]